MTSWAARARVHFSQECQNHTPITTITPLLGVLGVVSGGKPEKSHSDFVVKEQGEDAPVTGAADWRELDQAYQAHHFACPTCIAAGRGVMYGRRCAVGLVLWTGYSMVSASV